MDTQTKLDNVGEDYFLNGKKLIRVTSVMVAAGLTNTDFFTEEGRIRGTAVHLAADMLVKKTLDWDSVHPKCLPYVKGTKKFLDSGIFIPIPELCDFRGVNLQYGYTGKPDMFGLLNGYHSIVELKTGECSTADLQTAAYEELEPFKQYKPRRFLLQLKDNGKFKLTEYTNPNDYARFINYFLKYQKLLT
jgi:hypothetical protein